MSQLSSQAVHTVSVFCQSCLYHTVLYYAMYATCELTSDVCPPCSILYTAWQSSKHDIVAKFGVQLIAATGRNPQQESNQEYSFGLFLQYGEEAIKEGMGSGGGGGGMGDIFDLFGGGGRRQQPRERRGENVVHKLKVSLEEMYSGGIRKLSLSRNIKCDKCSGSGTKSGRRYQCEVRQLLPHLLASTLPRLPALHRIHLLVVSVSSRHKHHTAERSGCHNWNDTFLSLSESETNHEFMFCIQLVNILSMPGVLPNFVGISSHMVTSGLSVYFLLTSWCSGFSLLTCCGFAGMSWVRSAGDNAASWAWHDAADPVALLNLQSDWLQCAQPRSLLRLQGQGQCCGLSCICYFAHSANVPC